MTALRTDTSEASLERLICKALTGHECEPASAGEFTTERPSEYGVGWVCGNPASYDREYCVDLEQMQLFLEATQPEGAESLTLAEDGPTRHQFLARLQGEITKRGTVDVLRHGAKHGAHHIDFFYGTPSAGNPKAQERFDANRFSVSRQLRYSRDETQLALDLGMFINGLPVATFELKNSLTKQTVDDAIQQYKRDRNPKEKLFEFGRCVVHFAVDDQQVWFCTHLKGKHSWFLPFNKGFDQGAGNPPNPNGLMTDYLWKEVLTRESLTRILERYAQVIEEKDEKSGKKRRVQIWPRYHQLDVVRKLLADATENGAGRRYLIQHSAGSGKSMSIAWTAHQLVGLTHDGSSAFDSIIVVTDRVILDKQIQSTIKQFTQVKATVGHAERSGDLRKLIEGGKKIIVSTLQKFPYILDDIGDHHRDRKFAIIIDEAHSSQGGKAAGAMAAALSEAGADVEDEMTFEDQINALIESRKMLDNASYFAFTATPKNKTLEMFGELETGAEGKVRHRPFHVYSMKQAIQEGFILDVLAHYTPVKSYYRLAKAIEADPQFDAKKAKKKLRVFVEGNRHAIGVKAEIMVEHFHDQVRHKINSQARAMVVTGSIKRAVEYYYAIRDALAERKSKHEALVAFSGEHDFGAGNVSEARLNGFPESQTAKRFKEDPYRFLICADKFQTGYDEPLLHTMYVDKVLSGVKAVQTLSRLNRARPGKTDVFVLDFMNDADAIEAAFEPYYRTTVLSEETDPNKLHDLKSELDAYEVYQPDEVEELVRLFLGGADREQLDPILDACVAVYKQELDEDSQVEFKGKAKAFNRTYSFLSQILPYSNADWETLSIFLNFLVPKLPAPVDVDLSRGILEAIDMDSYRAERKAEMAIGLADDDVEIDPVPTAGGGGRLEPELDLLSNIIKSFNDQWGDIEWSDRDRVKRMLTEDIPKGVAADKAYQNALKNSDKANARIEHNKALERVIGGLIDDDTEIYKQFFDNQGFKRWLQETVFGLTYTEGPRSGGPG